MKASIINITRALHWILTCQELHLNESSATDLKATDRLTDRWADGRTNRYSLNINLRSKSS